jgi:hypothetical protein
VFESDCRQTILFAKNILQKRFRFVKYANYLHKIWFSILALKMSVLRPDLSNKMSRIPEPQPWISFVLVWTQKSNITLRRTTFAVNRPLLISSWVKFVISDLLFELDISRPTVDLCFSDSKRVSHSVLWHSHCLSCLFTFESAVVSYTPQYEGGRLLEHHFVSLVSLLQYNWRMRLEPFFLRSHYDGSPRSVRERVIALVEEGGLSASAAGGRYGAPGSTARAWLQKYRTAGQVGRRRGTGLWSVSSPAQDAVLVA